MSQLRIALFAIAIAPAAAYSADPALLSLVMPDAKVIAGANVAQARTSAFGQYVLAHMQPEDASFKSFVAATGFDPRRDIAEIVMASNWESNTPESRWLITARGSFNPAKIAASVQANNGTIVHFQGRDILSLGKIPNQGGTETDVAFLDSSYAVMGDLASVQAAIQRRQSKAAATSSLIAKVGGLSTKNDFWFITLVPLSEFSYAMPDPNLQGAMKGNLMQAITQASGGIRFGDPVNINAEAITRSDKDASALEDVVRFLANLLQSNRDSNQTAGQVASALDNLDIKTNGNIMTMSLAMPEKQLEQILNGARQELRQARPKAPVADPGHR